MESDLVRGKGKNIFFHIISHRVCLLECCRGLALPKRILLRVLFKVASKGFFDRARSGPEHGASSKNIAEQNKCGGSIRSHDSIT